jgi:hypothetical protein
LKIPRDVAKTNAQYVVRAYHWPPPLLETPLVELHPRITSLLNKKDMEKLNQLGQLRGVDTAALEEDRNTYGSLTKDERSGVSLSPEEKLDLDFYIQAPIAKKINIVEYINSLLSKRTECQITMETKRNQQQDTGKTPPSDEPISEANTSIASPQEPSEEVNMSEGNMSLTDAEVVDAEPNNMCGEAMAPCAALSTLTNSTSVAAIVTSCRNSGSSSFFSTPATYDFRSPLETNDLRSLLSLSMSGTNKVISPQAHRQDKTTEILTPPDLPCIIFVDEKQERLRCAPSAFTRSVAIYIFAI